MNTEKILQKYKSNRGTGALIWTIKVGKNLSKWASKRQLQEEGEWKDLISEKVEAGRFTDASTLSGLQDMSHDMKLEKDSALFPCQYVNV